MRKSRNPIPPVSGGLSPFAYHEGQALYRLAQTYKTILAVGLEAIQNSLDAEAPRIDVVINYKTREITITDDGMGKTQQEFEEALQSIGRSIKEAGKLGRFGLGLIAPIGKCSYHTFTSCAKEKSPQFIEWKFDRDALLEQRHIEAIPFRLCPELRSMNQLPTLSRPSDVTWRTQVRMVDITTDTFVSRINIKDFAEAILERFNKVLCEQNTVVHITFISSEGNQAEQDVRGTKFRGVPLKTQVIWPKPNHFVSFQLYLAPRLYKGREGKVSFGEVKNAYRISAKQFLASTMQLLSRDVYQALVSGVFEGDILSSKATWSESRKSFEQNDTLLELCLAMEEWYRCVGATYMEEVKTEKKEERWRDAGMQSLKVISEMLRQPQWDHLYDLCGIGHIGQGHMSPPKNAVVGTASLPATSVNGRHDQTGNPTNQRKHRQAPATEQRKHHPSVVANTDGSRRVLVRNGSIGLQLAFSQLPGSSRVYEFHNDQMLLELNVRHPNFVKCDEASVTARQKYIESVVMQALTIFEFGHSFPDLIDAADTAFNALLEKNVFSIINGSRILAKNQSAKKRDPMDDGE